MEVLVNPDGTRNRDFRPYIDQEESRRNVALFDPERPTFYGLYETAQPSCVSFQQHFLSRQHNPTKGEPWRYRGPARKVWPQPQATQAYRGNAYALLGRSLQPPRR